MARPIALIVLDRADRRPATVAIFLDTSFRNVEEMLDNVDQLSLYRSARLNVDVVAYPSLSLTWPFATVRDRPRLSERQFRSDLEQATIGKSPGERPADRLAGRAVVVVICTTDPSFNIFN